MTHQRRGGITDIPDDADLPDPRPHNPHEAALVVTYWAISVLSSRTMWINAVALFVAVLSLTEIVTVVPIRFMPTYTALLAVLNMILRFVTVRPVALIPPGEAKPIRIAKIAPPDPPLVTD